MCGIAGYIQRKPDRDIIAAMNARLAHRGPDGQGIWQERSTDWTVTLGHRRLSIIDLAGGAQPLANEDDSVHVTYNGEIYNFRDLQTSLQHDGHHFATRCDTEVIVHHYEQHRREPHFGLAEFNGMFAFGLWDQVDQRLLLARDPVGIKPLFYTTLPDGGIAFASELTALLEHPRVRAGAEIDPGALSRYFFSDYVQAPATLLRGISKLPPGHYVTWRDGRLTRPVPYWRLPDVMPRRDRPRGAALEEELRHLLGEAVRSQMVADVPLGVFLSGGIDSSTVAALAQCSSPTPIKTFSIGFDDPAFDESGYAREVAAWIGSEHVEHRVCEAAVVGVLDAALACLDEPVADPSLLPTYLLTRLAAQHVKVALSGDGGDELWAGYPTYKAHRLAAAVALMPGWMRSRVVRPLVQRLPTSHGYQSLEWKAKRFICRWDDDPVVRHLRWMSNTDLPDLRRLLATTPPAGVSLRDELELPRGDALNQILALDLLSYLPGSVLAKVDRASMAHGLEVRPPLLDGRLIELAFSLPSALKFPFGRTKALLKRAVAPLLPPSVLRREKKGFAIPLAKWINGALRNTFDEVVMESPIWKTGLLTREVAVNWLAQHREMASDRSKPLWALLVLDRWYRRINVGRA